GTLKKGLHKRHVLVANHPPQFPGRLQRAPVVCSRDTQHFDGTRKPAQARALPRLIKNHDRCPVTVWSQQPGHFEDVPLTAALKPLKLVDQKQNVRGFRRIVSSHNVRVTTDVWVSTCNQPCRAPVPQPNASSYNRT